MCSYKAMKLLVPRVRPCMCMRAGNLQLSRSEEHSGTLKTLQEKCTQSENPNVKIKTQIHEKTFLVNFKTTPVMKESTDFSIEFHSTFSPQGFAEHLEEFQVATGWWNQTGLEMGGCIGQIIFVTLDLISLAFTKYFFLNFLKINSNFFT